MNIVLTTFGTYLHRNGELFVIKVKEEKAEISARKVRSILITTGATLSTDAIELALEKNIDVVFMDKFGDPYGRVWHGKLGSTTAIRRQQLRIADTEDGLKLALSWMVRKIDNQIDYLISARQKRPRASVALTEKIDKLRAGRDEVAALAGTLNEMREQIFILEAHAGQRYWKAINLLLPEQYRFNERSRRPATDEFNCLLNYGYGVLYSLVERACILAGLDPYVGFIHTDNYNKKSLVFDLIECYRIWADETVVSLFATRQVKRDMFDKLHNGVTLNKEGKKVLMTRFDNFLDEKLRYHNRNVKRRETVQLDCHDIASQIGAWR
jgi:CRISPR-associated protein Cas1